MMMNNFSTMNLFTHHRGGGSTANGRSSAGRRLDTKRANGQAVNAGSVVCRQRGTKIHPGRNVGIGGDDALFTLVDGIVKFERLGETRKQVSVYPVEETE